MLKLSRLNLTDDSFNSFKASSIFSDILDMVFDTLYFFDLSRGAIVDYRIHIEPFAFNVMFSFLLLGTVKISLLIKIIYDLDLTDDDLASVAIKESIKINHASKVGLFYYVNFKSHMPI